MVGPVKDWLVGCLDQISSWNDFEAKFYKMFVHENVKTVIHKNVLQCKIMYKIKVNLLLLPI